MISCMGLKLNVILKYMTPLLNDDSKGHWLSCGHYPNWNFLFGPRVRPKSDYDWLKVCVSQTKWNIWIIQDP